MKEDVKNSLPPKEDTILEVAITPNKMNCYKAINDKKTSFLFKGAKPGNAPILMNVMMELINCCNKLFLIRESEERISYDAASSGPQKS